LSSGSADDFAALKSVLASISGQAWPLLSAYVSKRVRKARVVHRRSLLSSYVDEEGRELRSVLASQKVAEAAPPGALTLRDLEGLPPESAYRLVRVSSTRLKCTCQDSVITTAVAERRLPSVAEKVASLHLELSPGALANYSLCKHVISELVRAKELGVVAWSDAELLKTLTVALLALALRYGVDDVEGGRLRQVVEASARILAERGAASVRALR